VVESGSSVRAELKEPSKGRNVDVDNIGAGTIEQVKVKIQPLTREGMKLYGDVLDKDHPIFLEVDPGHGAVAMEINTLHRNKSVRQTLDQMAVHGTYTQSFIILKGAMIMVYAPAPADLTINPEEMEFNYDKISAFVLAEGDIAHINRGVWHGAVVLNDACTFVNITRKDSGEGTTNVVEVDDESVEYTRGYIELVNIRKRDGRQIILEL
jgi:ureidoglycolate hydrolase